MKKRNFWARFCPRLPRYYVRTMVVVLVCACMVTPAFALDDIYIMIGQSSFGFEELVIYREVKHIKDYSGGSNRFLPRDALKTMSYSRLLNEFRTLRKEGNAYEWAA